MANSELVVGTDVSSLLEQLGKAFLQLEAHTGASEDKVQWVDIEQHFHNLEITLKKKYEELEVREKEFAGKKSGTCTLLAEREAAVGEKEQGLFDRLQELKDAAVTAIAEARANYKPAPLEAVDGGGNKESEVSSSLDESNALTASEEKSPHRSGENVEGLTNEVKPRPELMKFCEQMDAKGLMSFSVANKKKLAAFRDELSIALESATEPAHLVLDSLEGFYPPDDTTLQGEKKDAALQGMRRSCIIFMEAMATLLARADPSADRLLNPETMQRAKAIAFEWKPKLAGAVTDAANGNSLGAEAFLQLLATFTIASEFDEEELCKLVVAVAHRRQAPELCRPLGLTHKMPGIVQELISSGNQIDAVQFIHTFKLGESFPPAHLLDTYLQDVRKNLQEKDGNSGSAGGAQNHAIVQELVALRTIIRCVEDCKLQSEYPLDPLRKRISQLEKSKAGKKRNGGFGKYNDRKKPRANGAVYGFHAPPAAAAAGRGGPGFGNRVTYMGIPDRYPHSAPNSYNYQIPNAPTYAQQINDPKLDYYAQDERVSSIPYGAAPPSYGSYMNSGMQPSHQPYM